MGNTLGELCTITKGITGIQKAIPGQYPLVVTAEERKSHNEYQFDDEAVVVPLVSGTGHGHASINRIHYQTGKFALGSILCAIIPKDKSILNAEYLFRFLNLNKDNELVARMRGMANVTLPIKEIAKIEIPLPTLADQNDFIEKYKSLEVDSQEINVEFEKQLLLVKQIRQAFLSEAIQGKLVLASSLLEKSAGEAETGQQLLEKIKAEKAQLIKDKKLKKGKELPPIKPEEIPFEIPEDWVWCRLGEVGKCYTGTTPSTLIKEYFKGEIPFIKPADISKNQINYHNESLTVLGLSKGTTIPVKSLMMVCIGGSIGKCFYTDRIVSCNQQINCLTPFNFNVELLNYFLQSLYFQKSIWNTASGGSTPIVNRSKWEKLLIPLPPLSIQNQIVLKLDKLMKTCDDLENSIKQSQLQNEQLLQQVLKEALEVKEEIII